MNGDSDDFGFSEEPGFEGHASEPDYTDDLPFDADGDWAGSEDPFEEFDTDNPHGFFGHHHPVPDSWLNVHGDLDDDVVAEARHLREAGHAQQAVELLRENLHEDGPWDASAHVELGLALDAVGEGDAALEAFRRAVALDPDEPHTLNHLGAALHERGNDRDALEQFCEANRIDPRFMPAIVNRIVCHAELGEHDRAEAMFYLAQQLDERCPRSFFSMGRSLELRGQHRRAIWCYRRCLALDTSEPMVPRGAVIAHLATCLEADGQTALALRMLREGLGRLSDTDAARPELLGQLANLLLDSGDAVAARAVLESLRELAPQEPSTLSLWGRLHNLEGDPEAAWDVLMLAAAGDPTFPRVHLQLAQLAARRQDRALAQRHLRAELLRRPRDADVLEAVAAQADAIADHGGCAAALRKLLLVQPNDAATWQRLGVAECSAGRLPEGLNALRRALEIDPRRVPAWHNLALALARHNEIGNAQVALRHGLLLEPANLPLRRLRWRLRLRRLLRL